MQMLLDHAIEEYRRRLFLESANAEYAALRADSKAWTEYQNELAVWE